jgi:hypothetical protein
MCRIQFDLNQIIVNLIFIKYFQDVIASNFTKVTIDCLDVSEIIKKYRPDDVLVLKMDIEGAEYDLILDFIKKDAIKLIDYIAVEFHPNLSPFNKTDDILISLINLFGIKSIKWN